MKAKHVIAIVLSVILIDQVLKIYIKTHFFAGEEHAVLGSWFRLHFVENEGMAWGWKFGGGFGKIALTLFRLVAVIWGTFIIKDFITKKYHKGFIVCAALIYAGASGNLIDSMFYGLLFDNSDPFMQNMATLSPASGGYAPFLHGKVVDMLYFPIITNAHYPSWVPYKGGQAFEFFEPVFNFADAAISVGVIILVIFQNTFFPAEKALANTVDSSNQVLDNS